MSQGFSLLSSGAMFPWNSHNDDMSNVFNMRRQFYDNLSELVSKKRTNIQFFTTVTYAAMIEKVKAAKLVHPKQSREKYLLHKFDVIDIGEEEKLIVPVKDDNTIKYFVHEEEIFEILHDTHIAIGHGGRGRMDDKIHLTYKNITREMVVIYLNLCEVCSHARKRNVQ